MTKKLPFILFLMFAVGLVAQTNTVTIDWSFNSTPSATGDSNASRTIEVGDTVTWNWYATGTHNVKSDASATENFESSYFGNGGTYSKTFNSVGSNDYVCSPHPSTMFGTITVVAEGALSLNNVSKADFSIYPNPSVSELNITMNQADSKTNVTVYNILGKQILSQQLTGFTSKINISQWNVGVYLVKVTNDSGTQTKRFVKQ